MSTSALVENADRALCSAGPGDAGPGSARNSDTSGQHAIIEEQAQRCAFHLQGVMSFALGELPL